MGVTAWSDDGSYTNEDISGSVAANTLVKVGGQEFLVEDYSQTLTSATGAYSVATSGAYTDPSKSFRLTLSEPFLGTSIIPVLTDTGSTPTALKAAALEMVTSAGGKITALTVGDFKSGAKLYVNGCPITSADTSISPNHLTVTIQNNNDCHYDAFPAGTAGDVVYRRTDDPNNQNVYATSGDTAAVSAPPGAACDRLGGGAGADAAGDRLPAARRDGQRGGAARRVRGRRGAAGGRASTR